MWKQWIASDLVDGIATSILTHNGSGSEVEVEVKAEAEAVETA